MPVHIDKMTSEVNVIDGDFPLNEAQISKLVDMIIDRLERRKREAQYTREATMIRTQAAPVSDFGE